MEIMKSGDPKIDGAVQNWLQWDKNPTTRQEVLDLVSKEDWSKLCSCMLKRLKFGTAGLRGRMAAGVGCMNDVVVLQTAQGLCAYLKNVCSESQLRSGIVVGFDGRYNSRRFAELTAKVFVSASVPVRLFSDVCPTPFVSYATIKYGCTGGVMVTASHNPKEDNGYKVYWGNGSQIITPHDDNILVSITKHLDIPAEHWDVTDIRSHPLVSDPYEDIMTSYCHYVRDSLSEHILQQNREQSIPIVYSAMHGVGYPAISRVFQATNLQEPTCVLEQRDPDPDFPTVTFPNPEEAECLELGRRRTEQLGARLLLANDPDADRLAVAEYDPGTGEWKVFSGNEMGALLGWWVLRQHKLSKGASFTPQHIYFIASVVSSKMLRSIARAEGCHFLETLTGFKWMGNKTHLLQKAGKLPMFAFEEAIGYMCNAGVPDKDGVSAAVQVASLATELYASDSSLCEQLQELYRTYGYHLAHNSYYICHQPEIIKAIFDRIRNYDGTGTYPTRAGGLDIVKVHDLVTGARVPSQRDSPPEGGSNTNEDLTGTGLELAYTGGEMVMLSCGNSLQVTVRTSGTEPKLKFYTELVTECNDPREQEEEKRKLVAMVEQLMEDLVQPRRHGLI